MLLHGFFQKKQIRRFSFIPFYYEKTVVEDGEETESRLKFRKILRSTPVAKKSVRGKFFLAALLVVSLFYLWGLVKNERSTFRLEDIRILETPE